MTILAPDTFALALTSLMRLGHEGRQAFLTSRANQRDLQSLSPDPNWFAEMAPDESERIIARWAAETAWNAGECDLGALFHGVMVIDAENRVPATGTNGFPALEPGRETDFEQLVAWALSQHHSARSQDMAGGIVLWHQRQWLQTNPASPWGRFARHMLDVSLDVVAARPGLIGTGGQAKALFAALAPNLATAYDADSGEDGLAPGRLAEAFAEAALDTLVENPSLVDDNPKWGPLITGVLEPLQHEVRANGARYMLAEGRLRSLFAGPMAHAALSAVASNADEFLKGSAGDEKVLGAVLRSTLGSLVSTGPEAFKLGQVFSADSARMVVSAALDTASKRPDLFIRPGDEDSDATYGRELLSGFADILIAAPRPFGVEDGLGGDIVSMALGVLGDYADVKLMAAASAHADSQMGAALASHLIGDLLDGFGRAAAEGDASLLATVFTRSQAVDVLQIMATHVAQSPDSFIGGSDNRAIRTMAETIATAIATDTSGLLTGEDWRGIVSTAMDAALLNPGTLFSLDPGDGPGDSVALVLIRKVLTHARDNMDQPPQTPGRLLFGATLREAVRVTLQAASTGILNTFTSRADMVEHLTAVDALMARLNGLAASQDRSLVIGASEWVSIYGYYIAHALETGQAGVNSLTDAQLMAVLRGSVSTTQIGGDFG